MKLKESEVRAMVLAAIEKQKEVSARARAGPRPADGRPRLPPHREAGELRSSGPAGKIYPRPAGKFPRPAGNIFLVPRGKASPSGK